MKFVLPLAVAAAMAFSSAAFAETTGTVAGGDQVAPKAEGAAKSDTSKPAYDPNEIVCKTSQVTGSRLGGHRVCHTRAEWDHKTREDQTLITNMQSHTQTSPGN